MDNDKVLRDELSSCRELLGRLVTLKTLSKHWKTLCKDEIDRIDEAIELTEAD